MSEQLHLNGRVYVAPSVDLLYDALGAVLLHAAIQAVEQRSIFHLALSGGKTPEPFFTRLVIDLQYHAIPWQQTHVWLVDERQVPLDDPRSNSRMIRESLLDHLPLRKRQIHPMPVLQQDAAVLYEKQLRAALQGSRGLDFVLLGMGDDGHTASLFPHSPALAEQTAWAAENDGPTVVPPPRLTLTYPCLNAARRLAVLVTGANKRTTLQRISAQLQGNGPDPQALPITGIQPDAGELCWYLDAAAAGAQALLDE